jgi:hypothetical protein
MEHRFIQPMGMLRGGELRQVALILFMKGDLQVPAPLVADLDQDAIKQPFFDVIAIHLSGCDSAGSRDQPLHATTSLNKQLINLKDTKAEACGQSIQASDQCRQHRSQSDTGFLKHR